MWLPPAHCTGGQVKAREAAAEANNKGRAHLTAPNKRSKHGLPSAALPACPGAEGLPGFTAYLQEGGSLTALCHLPTKARDHCPGPPRGAASTAMQEMALGEEVSPGSARPQAQDPPLWTCVPHAVWGPSLQTLTPNL